MTSMLRFGKTLSTVSGDKVDMRTNLAENRGHFFYTGRDAGQCLCVMCWVLLITSGCGGGQSTTDQTAAESQNTPPLETVVVRRVELEPTSLGSPLPVPDSPSVVRRIDLEAPQAVPMATLPSVTPVETTTPLNITPDVAVNSKDVPSLLVLPNSVVSPSVIELPETPASVATPAPVAAEEQVIVVTEPVAVAPVVSALAPVAAAPPVPYIAPLEPNSVQTPTTVPQTTTPATIPTMTHTTTPNLYQTYCESIQPGCTIPVFIWFLPTSPSQLPPQQLPSPQPVVYHYQWVTAYPATMYPATTYPAASPYPAQFPQAAPRWRGRRDSR